MRYQEIDNILEGQILESPYKEEVVHSNPEADTSLLTFMMYRVFYIFLIGSIFGCYMEQIQYYIQKGIWECRAGVIWGPFSEIYGFGAVLIYFIYRKMKDSSPLSIFGMSAICGATFEYIARLFQELVFHSITWDYSKQPFNLAGRTSLKYAICWGLLGLFSVKCFFPILDRQLDSIKGKVAFVITWILIVFMSFNLVFSAIAVNRWRERLQDVPADGYVEAYMDLQYDNSNMKQLFPHLKFFEVSAGDTATR